MNTLTAIPPRTATSLFRTVLLAGLLAFLPGCSPQSSELSADSAAALSSRLAAVRTSADSNDPNGALRELELLEKDVEGEAANGGMTFARFQSIRSSLQLVRTDLQALIQAAADEKAAEAAKAQAAKEEAAAADGPAPAAPAPAVIAPSVADPARTADAPAGPGAAAPGHGPGQGNGKAKSEETGPKGKVP